MLRLSDFHLLINYAQVEFDLKAEMFAGDCLESCASETEIPEGMDVPVGSKALLHVVRKMGGEDGKEMVRARSVWIPSSANL